MEQAMEDKANLREVHFNIVAIMQEETKKTKEQKNSCRMKKNARKPTRNTRKYRMNLSSLKTFQIFTRLKRRWAIFQSDSKDADSHYTSNSRNT